MYSSHKLGHPPSWQWYMLALTSGLLWSIYEYNHKLSSIDSSKNNIAWDCQYQAYQIFVLVQLHLTNQVIRKVIMLYDWIWCFIISVDKKAMGWYTVLVFSGHPTVIICLGITWNLCVSIYMCPDFVVGSD